MRGVFVERCSEAGLPCSRCDWVGEWASAGNRQLSQCIRKPIVLHSGVPTQLKSSAGRQGRRQPHFITAAARRSASDCCGRWFYWSPSVFDWLSQPDAAGKSRRMRRVSSILTLCVLMSSKRPVQTQLNRWGGSSSPWFEMTDQESDWPRLALRYSSWFLNVCFSVRLLWNRKCLL